ncbi:MAG TPA: hypothetical protein PKA41_07725 [Verrucomicrobiota bacterium]|nr:hypothetical protein [Verrucomicrobiota bacterium]
MKNQTSMFTTLVGCAAAAMLLVGCAQQQQQQQKGSYKPAPAPKAEPAPAPKTSCSDPTWGLIRMTKVMPAEAALGGEFTAELNLSAVGCAGNVVVRDTVPAGASYVRSEPSASVEGGELVWKLGNMDAGQSKKITVVFRADKEGNLLNCAVVSADPRVCAGTFVGKATLVIEKTGPETATLGSDVTYKVVVKNTGTAVAKDVVLTDPVPEGMGGTAFTVPIGDLAPGQSRPVDVTFKANKRGKVCNVATATSSNAGKVSDDACTTILQPGLKIEKMGTKEQILGRNADYQIVVSNTGDTALTDVRVTDTAPAATSIVAAPDAQVSGNTATWAIAEIKPGEKKSLAVKLTSKTEGTHCNKVSVAAGALSDSAEACTVWKGIGAVLLEVVDDPDPIQVGENTTYTIRITNQGFADLTNIKVAFAGDDETSPVSSPQGTVSGKRVSFPTVSSLGPKQVVTYTIIVRGEKAGDAINKVTLTCDQVKSEIEETESTTVY